MHIRRGLDPKNTKEEVAGWWGSAEFRGLVRDEEPGGSGLGGRGQQNLDRGESFESEFGSWLENGLERSGSAAILKANAGGRVMVHGAVRVHLAHVHAASGGTGNARSHGHAAVESGEGGLGNKQGCQKRDCDLEDPLHSLQRRYRAEESAAMMRITYRESESAHMSRSLRRSSLLMNGTARVVASRLCARKKAQKRGTELLCQSDSRSGLLAYFAAVRASTGTSISCLRMIRLVAFSVASSKPWPWVMASVGQASTQ